MVPREYPDMKNGRFLAMKSLKWSCAIATLSGILMSLATAPLNAFPLAWVALAPLWLLVQRSDCRQWWLLALLWGLGYHGLALAWITGLHPLTWMGIPWLGSVAIVAFAWAAITLWGAVLVLLWAWGLRQMRTWGSVRQILASTALWCGLEWLWSLGPLYWTTLSYTQSPGNPIILHLGQLSGPLTVTAAIVAVNGAVVWAVNRPMNSAEPIRKNSDRQIFDLGRWNWPIALCLILHLIGFSLWQRPIAQSPDSAVRVGIIQGNVPTRIKLSGGGLRQAIAGYTQGYETLTQQGVDVVLTPEGALPRLWTNGDDRPSGRDHRANEFVQLVQKHGVPLWLGTFVPQITPQMTSEGDRYTQSLLTITATGATGSQFNKIKLVPLGEYIPFPAVLGKLIGRLSLISSSMAPGTIDQIFDTPFGRAIAAICYESAFPAQFQKQAAAGGEFILTAANLDPYSEVTMAQHQAHDLMRAIETDRWAVRATNTGYSGLIDPQGRVVWRSQPHRYQAEAVTLYRRQTQTLYVRWGNWLTPLLLVVAGGWWLVRGFFLGGQVARRSP